MSSRIQQLITFSRTFNLGALTLGMNKKKLVDYLRGVHSLYIYQNIFPVRVVEISDIMQNGSDLNIFIPFSHRLGSTPLGDLAALAALTKKRMPNRIFEIGTFEGLSAVIFAKNSSDSTKVFTLDLPIDKAIPRTRRSFEAQSISGTYDSGYLINQYNCGAQVKRIFSDSALFDFCEYRDSIDLFFIDGAHTYDYCAIDSLNAFRCITANGWVIWHDCLVPDVFKVIKMIALHHPVFHIRGTNLALTMEKPSGSFPWKILEKKII